MTLLPLKTNSLKEQAFETIRDAIFAGEFRPGDPLREIHLARELKVSQSTIREALVKLEHLGLVVRVPNKATIVTQLSEQDIRERIAIRECLEEIAFTEAAKRMTEQDFQGLEQRLNQISDAIARNDYFEEAQADLEFHRYIWQKSGNKTLHEVLDTISVPLFAFVSMVRGGSSENLKETISPHENLVAALRGGDPDNIRKQLREHLALTGPIQTAPRSDRSVSATLPGKELAVEQDAHRSDDIARSVSQQAWQSPL